MNTLLQITTSFLWNQHPVGLGLKWKALRLWIWGILLLMLPQWGASQTQIAGWVAAPDQERLAYANVLLLSSADSTLVKGAVSAEDGSYAVEDVEIGTYVLSVSMVGYQTSYTQVFAIRGDDVLEMNVTAGPLGTALTEVEVLARRPLFEQQIDRMVVNVENNITAAGGNALEVLARSPGVAVNQQSGTISLRGKQGVLVMVNGKSSRLPQEALTQMLSTISADNIQQIEIFSTPPAQFDAEGDAGVINIVLRKREGDGLNGAYSVNLGYGRRMKSGANLRFNYRNNRWSLYGDYAPAFRQRIRRYAFDRTIVNENNVFRTSTNNEPHSDQWVNRGRLGLDFYWSDKTVVGFLFSAYVDDIHIESINNADYDNGPQQQSSVRLEVEEDNKWSHWMSNFNIKHQFDEQRSLSIDYDHLNYRHNNPSTYQNVFLNADKSPVRQQDLRIAKTSPIDINVGKIDYRQGLGAQSEWSTGLKGTFSRFSNEVVVDTLAGDIWQLDENFSQSYRLSEDIAAAYTSFSTHFGEKTQMIVGVRYELTLSHFDSPELLDPIERDYGNWFPSFFLAHQINEQQSVQLSFSRRITRPSFNELAPFVNFMDPTTYFSGNPDLLPGLANSLKADYQWKTIQFSFLYSYDEDVIVRYQPTTNAENNVQVYTTENLDRRHLLDFSINFPVYIKKWWEMQNSIAGVWQRTEVDNNNQTAQVVERSLWLYSAHTFILPKDFILQLTGRYQSTSYYGLLQTLPRGALDIGLQKKWGQNTLRFSLSDVFRTDIWESKTDIPELQLQTTNLFDVETRIARLTYSRTFGSKKVKGARNRATGSDAERSRVE
ncbi:MAG: TonB-dependent receptor [Bacteroidota bacterium]